MVFLAFLAASVPHRVHHLLEHLPLPKTNSHEVRALSLYSAPNPPAAVDRSAESDAQSSAHDHEDHDHSSNHHHRKKTGDHRDHSHSHAQHTHSRASSPTQSENVAEPNQTDPEPLHANAPERDAHHNKSARTDCIIQAAAQHAQVGPMQSAPFVFLGDEFDFHFAVQSVNFIAFDPSPLSQRAPPRA
jgi:ABC-type Zn2+ transport system substrate-binding protein/surface adhesin